MPPKRKHSIMSTEHALEVARYHLDKAESPGMKRYWKLVCKGLKAKLGENE